VSRRTVVLALIGTLAPVALAGQQVDRASPPPLGPPPALSLPPVRTATLPNGLRLYVVEMHEVPLVEVDLLVDGGGRADGSLAGLASFTADMLDERAAGMDAFQIAGEVEYLGASLSTGASWDDITVSLRVPKRNLGAALDLMGDVALRPTFAGKDVDRQRGLRLANIIRQQDQPGAMASWTFNAVVFPEGHPYHRPLYGDSASVAAFDSALVRQFYDRMFRPASASFVITGDITLDEARSAIASRFGGWKAPGRTGGDPATRATDARFGPTTVYLVDKPGAAQSIIILGHPGVPRSSPDFFPLEVMNTILGGSYSSRLNANLRETQGYTYGAGSAFVYRPLPGPFLASAAVRSEVTDSSLIEFFKELALIRDEPVSPVELDRARAYIALGLPGSFETTGEMAGRIGELLEFELPLDYYGGYVAGILSVTAAEVQRVARTYLRPDELSVVVVGDVAVIRAGIEALQLGRIVQVDTEGREVAASPGGD